MKLGDMVRIAGSPGIVAPVVDPGRLTGKRIQLSSRHNSVGLVVDQRVTTYGDSWFCVLFPEGLGWIQDDWCEVVQ